MTVNIRPMSAWMRATKYKPLPAPPFEGGPPTPDELALALALFDALDADSQAWYGGASFRARLLERLRG